MLLGILAFSVGRRGRTSNGGIAVVRVPAARHSQPDAATRTRLSMALRRIGSAGISVAGVYCLCLRLRVTRKVQPVGPTSVVRETSRNGIYVRLKVSVRRTDNLGVWGATEQKPA